MEQNDLLDSESIYPTSEKTEIATGKFNVLIPSMILDRFSYYGFRSLIILYVIKEFDINDSDAYSKFGLFTTLVYILSVLGGVLGDFVLKLKWSLIVGSVVAAIGAGICVFPSLELIYVGCILVIIGASLYKPNVISYVARITGEDLRLLDQRYLLLYLMINVGSFFGVLVLGLVSEYYGYTISFIIVALSWLLSAVLLYVIKGNSENVTKRPLHPKIEQFQKPSGKTLLLFFVPTIACLLFWLSYEHFYPRFIISSFEFIKMSEYGYLTSNLLSSIGMLVTFPLALILLFIFRNNWFHPLQKMAIGILLMAVTWGIFYIIPQANDFNSALFIVVLSSILLGIAELFIGPTILTLIGAMTPAKILGTITGVYFLIVALGSRFIDELLNFIDPNSGTLYLPWICVLLSFVLFILPYFLKKNEIE